MGVFLEDVKFSGAGDSLNTAFDSQLAVDMMDVRFHRIQRHNEITRDLPVRATRHAHSS